MKTHVITTDKDGGTYEVPVSELIWRPAAYAIIIQNGKILMSPQWGDGYDLPGGGVDPEELMIEGVIREVKEETGLDVQIDELVATRESFFTFRRKGKHTHTIALYYTAHVIGGELSTEWFVDSEKEYMRLAEWIPLEQLPLLKIYSPIDIKPIITTALNISFL
jgi:8-oxo-dGTP diphosphatase